MYLYIYINVYIAIPVIGTSQKMMAGYVIPTIKYSLRKGSNGAVV